MGKVTDLYRQKVEYFLEITREGQEVVLFIGRGDSCKMDGMVNGKQYRQPASLNRLLCYNHFHEMS